MIIQTLLHFCYSHMTFSGRNDIHLYNLTHVINPGSYNEEYLFPAAPAPSLCLADHRSNLPAFGRIAVLLFVPPSRQVQSLMLLAGTSAGFIHVWRQYATDTKSLKWKRVSSFQVFSTSSHSSLGLGTSASESISTMVIVNQEIVAVGSDAGSVTLLSMSQWVHSSFSSEMNPSTLIKVNVASSICQQFGSAESGGTPPAAWLGVQDLWVTLDQACALPESNADQFNILCKSTIHVVTKSGWVAKLTFRKESKDVAAFLHVVHSTPRATYCNTPNSQPQNRTKFDEPSPPPMICLPDEPCPSACMSSLNLCLVGVPPAVEIVQEEGRFDKYVVAQELTSIRRGSQGLLLLDLTSKPSQISNETNMSGTYHIPLAAAPTIIAVHPSDEWIVIASQSSPDFVLFSVRKQMELSNK